MFKVGLWFPDDSEVFVRMPAVPRVGDVVCWLEDEGERMVVDSVEWMTAPDYVIPVVVMRSEV
ncbi:MULTISPECIES: hypothetical protein [Streptomycetaceae]|uniref:hypothetical protein n=1 Tax=Streptomycetaceae TaxID=2062 RepID=UPI00093D9D3A|nr:hypothetical protein [Streptomyces sp. CB02056]OKI08812.1 hypothetical protein AMK13_10465 [Streptomyces sp. CB02056]